MAPSTILRAAAVAALLAAGCTWDWDRYVPGPANDAAATSELGTMDATGRCANDEECALLSSERPVCDTASGRCVACTTARDVCGAGRYCSADQACVDGCRDDQACSAATADGGAPATHCDPSTRTCAQCVTSEHCPAGTRCVDRACVAGCDSTRACPSDRSCCGGTCVDTAADPSHCGVCGSLCTAANGAPACVSGRCGVGRCNEPFGDCDSDAANGCETNTQASAAHCGACGRACAERPNTTATCSAGACAYACAAGFGDCDGDPGNGCEADVSRSLAHCGRCGVECNVSGGTGACVGGVCTRTACATGRGDCDGDTANGCEVDLLGDANHCRMCGTACLFSRGSAVCVAGACAIGRCDAGYDNCDGNTDNGCETALATSLAHCGACGRSCAFTQAAASCVAGTCTLGACLAGAGNCDGNAANGCEADFNTSTAHCGRCGGACPARANAMTTCSAGACGFTCSTGFGNCDGNAANGCEANLDTSTASCGACGRACAPPNAVAACRSGVCAIGSCLTGFADCDGNVLNGCEVDTRTAFGHCGGCGRTCSSAGGTSTCVNGTCTITMCGAGLFDCDGMASNGCETNPVDSNQHCGACGIVCGSGRTCQAGRCALASFGGYDIAPSPAGVDWIDACALPGMTRILANQDDTIERGILPFPVEFWGGTNHTYFVSSNGWVGFGDYYANIAALPMNAPYRHYGSLPRAGAPLPALFVFGIDLVQGPQGVCVATQGAAPNRRFVVSSSGAQLYDSSRGVLDPTSFAYELIAYESATHFDMVYSTPFMSPGGNPMVSATNVTVGTHDFRFVTVPRGVSYAGTITPTTRLRFTAR